MPVPIVYRRSGEQSIITFDYVDVAEGTGSIEFKGYQSEISGAVYDYHLARTDLHSHQIEKAMADAEELQFDTTVFNLPQTIRGTATVRFSVYADGGGGDSFCIKVKIQKIDADNNVTDIGETDNSYRTGAAASIYNDVLPISCTQTLIKKGEKIRLSVTVHRDAGEVVNLAFDPANRDGATITPASTYPTKLQAFIPFRIDL